MLKDDAIREGLMAPTEADIERMGLTKVELAELSDKRAAVKTVTTVVPAEVVVPAAKQVVRQEEKKSNK